jgi:hypothetical protein
MVTTLTHRLEQSVNGDSGARIEWLVDHLKQYMYRWAGFARLEGVAIPSLQNSDLFMAVCAAVYVVNRVLDVSGSTRPFPSPQWAEFCRSLEELEREPTVSSIAVTVDSFGEFVASFDSREHW